jgi:hypothetical protein
VRTEDQGGDWCSQGLKEFDPLPPLVTPSQTY